MRNSSGDARLANRLHVLQLRQLEPSLGVRALARRVGVDPSTVRSMLKRYAEENISVGAPPARRGAGRPVRPSERTLR